jgi:hypothetical protein
MVYKIKIGYRDNSIHSHNMNAILIQHIMRKNKYKDVDILFKVNISTLKEVDNRKKKYEFMKNIINNVFIQKKTRDLFIDFIGEYNSILFLMDRVKYKYKFKTYKRPVIPFSLTLIPMKDISREKRICILQKDNIYDFYLEDLKGIYMNAITFSDFLIIKPYIPLNPFTNIQFSLHHMINVLRKMIRQIDIHPLLYSFYSCGCNLELYIRENKVKLQEMAVAKYMKQLHHHILFKKLCDLIFKFIRYRCNKSRVSEVDMKSITKMGMKSLHYYYYTYYYNISDRYKDYAPKLVSNLFRIVEAYTFTFHKNKIYKVKRRLASIHTVETSDTEYYSSESESESESESPDLLSSEDDDEIEINL